MSAILVLSLVAAVVPGAVQIDRAIESADADATRSRIRAIGARPGRAVAGFSAPVVLSTALAAFLHLDLVGATAIGVQFLPALRLSALRGMLMGSDRLASLGKSYAVEAAVRLFASCVLGIIWGEAGFGIGILLATLAALRVTSRSHPLLADSRTDEKEAAYPSIRPALSRPSIVSSAAAIGFAVALANADLLLVSRNLPPAEADAFAAAAIPAKGIFVALFVVGWVFFAKVRKNQTPGRAVRVGVATVLAGLALTIVFVTAAPIVGALLDQPTAPTALVALLCISMAFASGTWTVVNLTLSLGGGRAWAAPIVGIAIWLILGWRASSAVDLTVSLLASNAVVFFASSLYASSLSSDRVFSPGSLRRWRSALAAALRRLGMDPFLGFLAVGAITVLSFLQQPGKLLADTKIDLAIDPIFFLRRAYDMWEPLGYFGHVQNQSYGYFFPMGLYFAASKYLGIPMWVAQRVWIAATLATAFSGVAFLAKRLGIGTPRTRVAAAALYVTAPVFASIVAFTSAAAIPGAVLPWMVGFLTPAGRRWTPGGAAARSAAAFAFSGAVNAAATVATLPALAVFFITEKIVPKSPGDQVDKEAARVKAKLIGATVGMYSAVSLWWAIPLVLLRRYGFNFIQYTESADAASSTQSLFESLRGSGYWLAYLNLRTPWLPGGWEYVSSPILVAASGALTAAGLAGLAYLGARRRFFAPVLFLVGAAATSSAYWFSGAGFFHSTILSVLNGPLSAFRNVSKFTFLVTLPLSLGIAHLGPALGGFAWKRAIVGRRVLQRSAFMVLAGCLLVMAIPAIEGKLAAPGGFDTVPEYWIDAVEWLESNAADGRVAVIPGAPFGEYEWGRPLDDVLQPLSRVPWAVRSLIPLGGTGSTRLLDALEDHLLHQSPSPALAPALSAAGVRYLVVRNDLDWRRSGAPRPLQVKRTLEASEGFKAVAAFGMPGSSGSGSSVGDRPEFSEVVQDLGVADEEARLPKVVIYEVDGGRGAPAGIVDLTYVAEVAGGSESRLSIDSFENLRGTPFVLSSDSESRAALAASGVTPRHLIITDDLRRRDNDFGLVHFNYSYTLGAGERPTGMGATERSDEVEVGVSRGGPIPREIMPKTDDSHKTTREFRGAGEIKASSYSSWLVQLPELRPYAAFDGDFSTAWVTGAPGRAKGEWIEVVFDDSIDIRGLKITPLADHPFRPIIREVEIETDSGSVRSRLEATETAQPVAVPEGPTKRLRVILAAVDGEDLAGASGAGIREITLPGRSVEEVIKTPVETSGSLESVVLSRRRLHPALVGRSDEEKDLRRLFRLSQPGTYAIEGTVVPLPGDELDRLIEIRGPIRIAASSVFQGLPDFRPSNLLDGDTSTIWAAALSTPLPNPLGLWEGSKAYSGARTTPPIIEGIQNGPPAPPSLVLSFDYPVTLDELRILTSTAAPAAQPAVVRLVGEKEVREVEVSGDGWLRFDPIKTRVLRMEFTSVKQRISVDGMTGISTPLPVGFADIHIPALSDVAYSVPLPEEKFSLPCGAGPPVLFDGDLIDTEIEGRISDLIFLRPLKFRACKYVEVGVGGAWHRIDSSRGSRPFAVADVAIARRDLGSTTGFQRATRELHIEEWGPRLRTVRIAPGPARVLFVNENFNAGWRAFAGEVELQPLRLDGWKQAFVVPAGAEGEIRLQFEPGRLHSLSIVGGLAIVGLILSFAILTGALAGKDEIGAGVTRASRYNHARGLSRHHSGAVLAVTVGVVCSMVSAPVFPIAVVAGLVAFIVGGRVGAKAFASASASAAAVSFLVATTWAISSLPAAPSDGVGPFGLISQVAAGLAMTFVVLPGIAVGCHRSCPVNSLQSTENSGRRIYE